MRSGSKNTKEKRIPNPSKIDRSIPERMVTSPNQDRFLIYEQKPSTATSTNRDEPSVFSNNVMKGSLSYAVGETGGGGYIIGIGVVGIEITGMGVVGIEITGMGVVGIEITGMGVVGIEITGMGVVGIEITGMGVVGIEITGMGEVENVPSKKCISLK